MPLTDMGRDPLASSTELRWQMTDGEKAVVISTTVDVIYAMEPGATDEPVNRFERYRPHLNSIASRKFDAGQIEDGGMVRVRQPDLYVA
ncbi:hypothetical protein [Terrihabitans sp. B22-R8]|uniref:hypothetical protein n=1 Tax=Terrihabitans sp. B22-R8 TaxID=3425128 RepID=UPI00403CFFF3